MEVWDDKIFISYNRDNSDQLTYSEFASKVSERSLNRDAITISSSTSPIITLIDLFAAITKNCSIILWPPKLPQPAWIKKVTAPADGPYIYLTTSATTSSPKLVGHRPSSLWANAKAVVKASEFNSEMSWGCALSPSHVGGLMVALRAYCQSGTAYYSDKILDLPKTTHLSLVPSQFYDLLHHQKLETFNDSYILIGGSKTAQWIIDHAKSANLNLHTSYAMSETASTIAIDNRLLPIFEAYGQEGELYLKSLSLFSHYLTDKGRVLPFSNNNFFKSGDCASVNGNKITIHGRQDDLIVSGGVKVFPEELEKKISTHFNLKNILITAIDHPKWGEAIVALIRGEIPSQEKFKELLDPREVPKFFLEMPDCFLNLDKIKRDEIKKWASQKLVGSG